MHNHIDEIIASINLQTRKHKMLYEKKTFLFFILSLVSKFKLSYRRYFFRYVHVPMSNFSFSFSSRVLTGY